MTTTPVERATPSLSYQVADEIMALLGRRRMSQRKLALKLGKSPAWLNYRLTGVQPIDLNDLAEIAEALEVPVAALLPATIRNGAITQPYDILAERPAADTRRTPHSHGSRSHDRPANRADRSHKPDTGRTDPRRPRILPRPATGAA